MTQEDRFQIKRVYEPAAASDGARVLVDRLWPRGVRKEDAHIELWLKDVAPSAQLRRWFGHEPARWAEFRRRYHHELAGRADSILQLRKLAEAKRVTLVYSAHDERHNQARALAEYLTGTS
jgi:uncharacterized protein YeaO (DUF488 family)